MFGFIKKLFPKRRDVLKETTTMAVAALTPHPGTQAATRDHRACPAPYVSPHVAYERAKRLAEERGVPLRVQAKQTFNVRAADIALLTVNLRDGIGIAEAAKKLASRGVKTPTGLDMTYNRLYSLLYAHAPNELARIQQPKKQSQPKQTPTPDGHRFGGLPLELFCRQEGIKLSRQERAFWGATLSRYCREKGRDIGRIESEQWGHVNTYPIDVLKEFAEGYRHSERSAA